jgi:lipoprotein-anchoring transpeptidase ErfK/SrfK
VLKWLPVVLAVLIVLAGSSIWGRQVIAQRLAHSSYNDAKSLVTSDIQSAAAKGLYPHQVHSFAGAAAAIETTAPPSSSSFLSTTAENFYNHQGSRLNALDRQLRHLELVLRDRARGWANTLVGKYSYQVNSGTKNGLQLQQEKATLASARAQVAADRTTLQYRAFNRSIEPKLKQIKAVVRERQRSVNVIWAVAHSSGQPVRAVHAWGLNRVSAAQSDLGYLTLFDKKAAKRYSHWIDHLQHWLKTQTWARYSVVAAADIDAAARQIHQRVVKKAPAKWILVSTENQNVQMYQGTTMVNSSDATTGGPQLPTDHGYFHIYEKVSPFVFQSPWPPGSQYWYPDSPVSYWMPFYGGEGLHDAPWRSNFGPGSNYQPTPGTQIDGTHGCVNLPTDVAAWMWNWAPIGTPVIVV